MSKAVTNTKYYNEIAKTIQIYGSNDILTPSEMADAIHGIIRDAESRGEREGYNQGYGFGYTDGEVAGKQTGIKEFMQTYQSSAASSDNRASRLFSGTGWNSDTFYPVMDIDMSASNVFNYFAWGQNNKAVDLVQRLKECDVKLDCTNGLGAAAFAYAWVTTVPKLIISNTNGLTDTFRGATILVTIEELAFPAENDFTFSRTFENCTNLQNITITGCIGSSVDFRYSSLLTSESVDSIVAALKTLGEDDTAKTLTLHSTVKGNLTEAQTATIAEKGWTLA